MTTKTKLSRKPAAKAEPTPEPTKPAKGKKVLGEKDIPIAGKTQTAKELRDEQERELRKESAETGAPRANTIGRKSMANGVKGRDAPHSAKALADQAAKERATTKEAAKPSAKATAKAKRAEAKKAKAAPKADDERKITILDKKFTYGREGTSRRMSWDACVKSKTVAEYAKAGGALKYLPRWVSAGAIKLG